jgi:hypothetical protein
MCVIMWIGRMDCDPNTLCQSPEDHTPRNKLCFFRIKNFHAWLTTSLKYIF